MSDRILLLYALEVGNETGCIDGTFKLMKIPFMAELASTRAGFNTFHYSFYRYKHGPFTTEIYDDADALFELGLATSREREPALTAKGRELLKELHDIFEEERSLTDYVEIASRECAELDFEALKDKVYRELVRVDDRIEYTIAKAPMDRNVLRPLSNPKKEFQLSDDWIDTLWGQFNYSSEDLAMRSVILPSNAALIHALQ